MPRDIYVNGRYLPKDKAWVHVQDRGYLFGDGVYEVIACVGGRLMDEEPHLTRLLLSLQRLSFPTLSKKRISLLIRNLVERNRMLYGSVYIQVTRGRAERSLDIDTSLSPTLVIATRPLPKDMLFSPRAGVRVTLVPDQRWDHCHIKATGTLLVASMIRHKAQAEGFNDAMLYNSQRTLVEATFSNAWVVDEAGLLRTCPLSQELLWGITRKRLLQLITEEGLAYEERAVSVEEVYNAQEIFLSSSVNMIVPVLQVDHVRLQRGPVTERLHALYTKWLNKCMA